MRNSLRPLKSLRGQPVFFATAALTLAVGIAFNALMFTAVHGVYLRPLSFPQGDSLISLQSQDLKLGTAERTTPADFFDWREQATTLSRLGGYTPSELHVFSNERARRLPGATVTVGFFDTLGVQPVIGRLLADEDFERDSSASVVLSEGFWRREFGSELSALDRTIKVASRPYRIVGVVPDNARLDTHAELWVPMAIDRSQASRTARFLNVIGRRQPTATMEAVEAEMSTISQRLAASFPETNDQHGIRVTTLRATLLRDLPEKLIPLWCAAACVLLIICANISLLLLASTSRRQGEFAVRIALGATRRQIAEQLLAEMAVVTASGGMLGLALVALGFESVRRLVPDPILLAQAHLGGLTVLFVAGLSLLLGVVLGCVAVLRIPKRNLRSALSSNDRGQTRTRSHWLQKALVVAEVAITVALMMSSGLMLRTLQHLWSVDPGYDVDSVSTVSVLFPPRTYPPGSEQLGNYFRQATEKLAALPGVSRAASGFLAPLEGTVQRSVQVEGIDFGDLDETQVALQAVSSSYFDTMGVEIKLGRAFDDHERSGVALGNEALVRLLFGETSAIGRWLKLSSPLSREPSRLKLVGVVESEHLETLAEKPTPTLYVPHEVELLPMATLYFRQANPSIVGLARSVEETLHKLDPEVAVNHPKSMRAIFHDSLNGESNVTFLLGVSSCLALILALLGVYGIWTIFVSERQREFGIRLSLGAGRHKVLREVLYQNMKLTTSGLGLGILFSLYTTRFIRQWLFEVRSDDPGTLVSTVVAVAAASVVAGIVPAWRASRVDVIAILRDT